MREDIMGAIAFTLVTQNPRKPICDVKPVKGRLIIEDGSARFVDDHGEDLAVPLKMAKLVSASSFRLFVRGFEEYGGDIFHEQIWLLHQNK